MARNSTRYLVLAILIIAVFLLVLFLLKNNGNAPQSQRQEVPQQTEQKKQPQAQERAQTQKPAEERQTPQQTTPKQPKESPARKFDYLPASANRQIIRHSNFTLSYVEKHEQAEWVAYELTGSEVQGKEPRDDNFREDPKVSTGSATPADYYRSGYDRGHLAPAGDMKFSKEAMSESFYMSNMSPQAPQFNRGIWRVLEESVRVWALENESLYVVTGPVFGNSRKTIGEKNKVTVPEAYYKVLLDYTEPEIKAIGFILHNKGSKKDIFTFAVPIDSVEKVTGIDFFPALPDAEEELLESQVEISLWVSDPA